MAKAPPCKSFAVRLPWDPAKFEKTCLAEKKVFELADLYTVIRREARNGVPPDKLHECPIIRGYIVKKRGNTCNYSLDERPEERPEE